MADIQIDGVTYVYEPNPLHRNRAKNKSQWTISTVAEQTVFTQTVQQDWREANYTWGFHMKEGKPQYLGVDRDHKTLVFMARFEARTVPQIWHG